MAVPLRKIYKRAGGELKLASFEENLFPYPFPKTITE
jgi:hypothetical protein